MLPKRSTWSTYHCEGITAAILISSTSATLTTLAYFMQHQNTDCFTTCPRMLASFQNWRSWAYGALKTFKPSDDACVFLWHALKYKIWKSTKTFSILVWRTLSWFISSSHHSACVHAPHRTYKDPPFLNAKRVTTILFNINKKIEYTPDHALSASLFLEWHHCHCAECCNATKRSRRWLVMEGA